MQFRVYFTTSINARTLHGVLTKEATVHQSSWLYTYIDIYSKAWCTHLPWGIRVSWWYFTLLLPTLCSLAIPIALAGNHNLQGHFNWRRSTGNSTLGIHKSASARRFWDFHCMSFFFEGKIYRVFVPHCQIVSPLSFFVFPN